MIIYGRFLFKDINSSKKECKTIYLQDPRIDSKEFDIVWAPEHDSIEGNNVVKTITSPNRVTNELLNYHHDKWLGKLSKLKGPFIGFLIGGKSKAYNFNDDECEKIIQAINFVISNGYTPLITLSRRSPKKLSNRIKSLLTNEKNLFYDGKGDNPYFAILKASEFKEMTGLNEGLTIKSTQAITIVITMIVVSIMFWFLNKTKTGTSMRAYSDNEDLALLSGIDPKKVVLITWIIAGILATIGGVLYGLDKSYRPFVYFNNMLPIFAAAIVGGIGNPFGAFLGGYVIAFAEIFLTYAYKKFFTYILPEALEPNSMMQILSTDYKFAVSFSILVIVLLFRPSGIFKGKTL